MPNAIHAIHAILTKSVTLTIPSDIPGGKDYALTLPENVYTNCVAVIRMFAGLYYESGTSTMHYKDMPDGALKPTAVSEPGSGTREFFPVGKVRPIKAVRLMTGLGLKESKLIVDTIITLEDINL